MDPNGNGHRRWIEPQVTLGNLINAAVLVLSILSATVAVTRAIGQIEVSVAVMDNRMRVVERTLDRLDRAPRRGEWQQ